MSVRKKPGRWRKTNVFEVLPYMIMKEPELDPLEILGEDIIKKYPSELIKETFEFVAFNNIKRYIFYSMKTFKFKCIWCGKILNEVGMQYEDMELSHRLECECPFIIIDIKNVNCVTIRITNNKQEKSVRILNKLSNNYIVIKVKKKEWSDTELLQKIKKNINLILKENQTLPILKSLYDYSCWFKINCTITKNGKRRKIKITEKD